jgi:hypothetical protein
MSVLFCVRHWRIFFALYNKIRADLMEDGRFLMWLLYVVLQVWHTGLIRLQLCMTAGRKTPQIRGKNGILGCLPDSCLCTNVVKGH